MKYSTIKVEFDDHVIIATQAIDEASGRRSSYINSVVLTRNGDIIGQTQLCGPYDTEHLSLKHIQRLEDSYQKERTLSENG